MKGKDIAIGVLTIIAGVLILLLIDEQNRSKKKDLKIKGLRKQNKDLLTRTLKEKEQIPEDIKSQLIKLIDQYEGVEENVCNELIGVLALIEIGQEVKAIKDLAKIIENLLKEKYKEEKPFKGKKFIPLAKLIEYAKSKSFFNDREYNTACILRDFRNEESHQLNVNDSRNMTTLALIGGIELIVRLDLK
tara:strand:+ start:574 stop:1143 length:570 start_codon:yes stop_codon:yes gene_type:complete